VGHLFWAGRPPLPCFPPMLIGPLASGIACLRRPEIGHLSRGHAGSYIIYSCHVVTMVCDQKRDDGTKAQEQELPESSKERRQPLPQLAADLAPAAPPAPATRWQPPLHREPLRATLRVSIKLSPHTHTPSTTTVQPIQRTAIQYGKTCASTA
jgi:hypothetical protein